MKMFSDCSGECCLCACAGFCLAGHGDDDFCPATKDQIIDRLNKGEWSHYKDFMIDHLLKVHGHEYDPARFGFEKSEPKIINRDEAIPSDDEVLKMFGDVFGNE